MTDPSTKYNGEERYPARTGAGFEWTSRGSTFNWGAVFGWLHGIVTRGRRIL